LAEGQEINSRNSLGRTPFLLAAKDGFIEVVKFIIDQNGNIFEKDIDGRTAIHLAASEGKLDMVKYLYKECGLDINEQDWRGLTALHLGLISSNYEFI
jgi:ankyrin repeat protein